MNVLIIGSGGREHALAWKIKQSPKCSNLYCLPGNPGTQEIAQNIDVAVNDFQTIKSVCIENKIDMVVVGPEEPLVKGIRDFFSKNNELKEILFVGPDSQGATLEGSKEFAKKFMQKYNIPTASFKSVFKETIEEGDKFLEQLKAPYVLKADGLAAGKGVLIINDIDEAKKELREILNGKFGEAGNCVVIEEYLSGIEVSFFILTDGENYLLLPSAKDYKRIGEGDKGLNTGGMGAISPVPFVTEDFTQKVKERIILPTIEGLKKENIEYKGFIFIGLMNCNGDPYVVEYNVRMGDPETEVVMTRIDSDFLEHLIACAKGELKNEKLLISDKYGLTVICVSEGYPMGYKKGINITINSNLFNQNEGLKLFHCGTKISNSGTLVTNGGRVFAITANCLKEKGLSDVEVIEKERDRIYSAIDLITYSGKVFRKDIGLDIIGYLSPLYERNIQK